MSKHPDNHLFSTISAISPADLAKRPLDTENSVSKTVANLFAESTSFFAPLDSVSTIPPDISALESQTERSSEKKPVNKIPNDTEQAEKFKDSSESHPKSSGSLSLSEIAAALSCHAQLIVIDQQLYEFTGKIYEKIEKKDFIAFVQRSLPEAMQKKIVSLRVIADTYEWLRADQSLPHYSGENLYIKNRFLIPFSNGVYDAKQGRLLPYTSDYVLLYQIDARYQDYPSSAPTWDSFCDIAFNGSSIEKHRLLEMTGYLLMPCNDAKVFFILGTAPDCGKSQYANFLSRVLGPEQVSRVNLHDFKGRFNLEQTAGKIVNFCMDLQAGALKDEAVSSIKQVTGECWISVEAKYEAPRAVFNFCRLVCGTNHAIKISGIDPAFWSRAILIPFLSSCPEAKRDNNLAQNLYAERDDILSLAAQAAHELVQRGLLFTPSEIADSLLTQWSTSSDSISAFIESNCEITGSKDDYIEINELFETFQQSALYSSISLKYFSKEVRARYSPSFLGNNNKKRIGKNTVSVIFGLRWKTRST